MRRRLPRGTVTFLFTDVEGSTRLLHELGAEKFGDALAQHRRLIREACEAHGGVEVDTQGDAFFFAFPRPSGAVAAASAVSEGFREGPIHVRIGVHTGRPLLTDEGYVGEDVHLAARIAASAHGGQVVFSRVTQALLDPRFSTLDLGEHRLKDIVDPVSIFQLGAAAFPPLRTISNTNLPRPPSSFVGRERELRDVLGRIETGARLVTLTGPGGSGKTRLAIEAAASLVPQYKAGVFWIGLAALRDPALVIDTIARSLGARDGLAGHIGEREMLLLLDNFEQVVGAAPDLAAVLTSCPNLTLLVTSRELLRVAGEVEYGVPSLDEGEAVSLFCQRVQLAPTEEIAELCRRLDNLPLAVELAAARARAMSPTQIVQRLAQRLDLLKGGRDADPRQRTLRTTIEWSYELLPEVEKQLFRRLAVFAGGWTLEAAEDVCEADIGDLQSLVDKSLLRYSDERYSMLETIGEYAHEKLNGSDELEMLRERHFAYMHRLAQARRADLWDARHAEAMRFYELEHPNVRAALSWARGADRGSAFLRLASVMAEFWSASDHLREGRGWLEEALAVAPGGRTIERAWASSNASGIAFLLGDVDAAEFHAREAVKLYGDLGDLFGRALATCRLANVHAARRAVESARALYEQALEFAHASGNDRLTAIVLENAGTFALEEGLIEPAEARFIESVRLFRRLGNRRGLAICLAHLADVALVRGDRVRAAEFVRESLLLYRGLGTKVRTAPVLETASRLVFDGGDPERAARLLAAARHLRRETGSPPSPHQQRVTDDLLARFAAALGEERITALGDETVAMTLSEALDDALASLR